MTSPQVIAPTSYHKSKSREAVLIIAHGDGWLEAYAEKHVDIRIEMLQYMATPEGQILAEEYLKNSLPYRYRQLYWPGQRRAADLVRKIRPSDLDEIHSNLKVLQLVKAIGDEIRSANADMEGAPHETCTD